MNAAERLGAKVREVRSQRGWSQAELARRLGVSQAWVSRVEAGQGGGVPLEMLPRIARALRISTSVLLGSP